ncbi:hypothetical protein EDB81DRAFT_763552 [Dactylonectria macrodidyma]|uniref:Uncharacterized protein n=1 Tax=Dactylonectria macrodidyma TaxID=307937 RepID=A0A9P9E3Q9_9HYPO|nr:hypothetical protein EDB81DRAFT_763552 [Dactylonectria macrodidyma]
MHIFKLLPLFMGLSLALPAAEADPNSLEARACTYSTTSLPSLLAVVDQFTHQFAGSCVSNCCKAVSCNGFLNCGRSTCSGVGKRHGGGSLCKSNLRLHERLLLERLVVKALCLLASSPVVTI